MENDLEWISFIKRAKATGMTLSKIVQYSKLRERGEETIDERIDILEQQVQLLFAEKEKIQSYIDFLENKKKSYARFKK